MGDDFVTYGFPFIDVERGGSIDGMIDGVEKVMAQLPADVKVIPGHGPVSNVDDVRAYLTMLKETRATQWREGPKEGQDARSDEAGEDPRALEEVFRRLHHRRRISRDVLQFAYRPEERQFIKHN